MTITEISETSWDAILRIQEEAYTGIPPEEVDVLKSKWHNSPDSCFVFLAEDEKILAYLLAHSWGSLVPPKLFEPVPTDSAGKILYLHDLAVSKDARGLGLGKQLANKLIDSAKNKQYEKVLLVAVQGSGKFWASLGFKQILDVPVCASYGADAKLMSLALKRT